MVQLSFTLPVPISEKAKEAARLFAEQMGFKDVKVAAAEPAADHYTFFIVYAHSPVTLDYASIEVPEVVVKKLGFDDLNHLIEEKLQRRVVVFGACTGTDTHTVGIDAILNMKGYDGDYGLERYPWFEAYNLGSQVPNDVLDRQGPGEERRRDPGQPGRHPARRAQGQLRGSSSRRRKEAGLPGKTHPPARRAARGSQARAGARLRRRLRPGHQAVRRGQLHRPAPAAASGAAGRGRAP